MQDEQQATAILHVGQTFDDYNAFAGELAKFEAASKTKFSILRSDKIPVKPGYSSVALGCKHFGGKMHNPNLTGARPRQS